MNDKWPKARKDAQVLMGWGYRVISRRHRNISRIDREDWLQYMARRHAPWDPWGEGITWANGLGQANAEDHYRRIYSRDKMTVSENVLGYMETSSGACTGYRHKRSDRNNEDNQMGTRRLQEPVDPVELQGMYKVHSISVITGHSSGNRDTFHPDFESAKAKAESIVRRDPGAQIVLLKITHVVQASGPPVDVIELDELDG